MKCHQRGKRHKLRFYKMQFIQIIRLLNQTIPG